MPYRLFTLGSELEVASDDSHGIQDEGFVIEFYNAVALGVFALLAVPLDQRWAAATGVLIHEAHGSPICVVLKPFRLLTEVGWGTITLLRPIDVLHPSKMPLDIFHDLPNTLRHAGVGVVSGKNEMQAASR
jgi:hypothetical protein